MMSQASTSRKNIKMKKEKRVKEKKERKRLTKEKIIKKVKNEIQKSIQYIFKDACNTMAISRENASNFPSYPWERHESTTLS